MRFQGLVAGCAIPVCACSLSAQGDAATRPAVVLGRVTAGSDTTAPVANALVDVDSTTAHVRTDSAGRFIVVLPRPGEYVVRVRQGGLHAPDPVDPGHGLARLERFDELNRKLERLGDNTKALHGDHQVPFSELFPSSFMCQHGKVDSFEALLRAGGFDDTPFADIPDEQWDQIVATHTEFADWNAMKEAAVQDWARSRVLRGV